jgi:hypothetical protein
LYYEKNILLFWMMAMAAMAANANPIYVKSDALGNSDGACWANAFTTIGAAIAAASDGDVIYVAGGAYAINASLPQKAVAIYGGFAGNEAAPDPAQRARGSKPWELTNPTVVDASEWTESGDRIFASSSVPVALTLDGLTFQNRFGCKKEPLRLTAAIFGAMPYSMKAAA